ncbi:MAG: hypothetical protein JO323_08395 [Acidobacteriia bacterium]|nr:hypothetical protein [Terriglobia bacterium]
MILNDNFFADNRDAWHVTIHSLAAASSPCSIASQTLVSVPGQPDTRKTVGVGEWVKLTTDVSVTWAIASGGGTITHLVSDKHGPKCSTAIVGSPPVDGMEACFTAPNWNGNSVVSASLANGAICSTPFTTKQPTGLIFQRLEKPGYNVSLAPDNNFSVHMVSAVFLTPGDVSFANVGISELDTPTPSLTLAHGTPLLFTVAKTQAWFLGCDDDLDGHNGKAPLSKKSYWTYVNIDNDETRFSLVETKKTRFSWSDDYHYSKGQIEALSPNGAFVPDLGPAATLSASAALAAAKLLYNFVDFPSGAMCESEVKDQFPDFHAVLPSR